MALLTKSDLHHEYSWTALAPDDPKLTGKPDSTLLNRHEGYEVLAFINRLAETKGWTNKALGQNAERLIREHLPGSQRSHAHVRQWLDDNWNNY